MIINSMSQVGGEEVEIYIEVDKVPDVSKTEGFYRDTRDSPAQKTVKAVGDLFGNGLDLTRKCAVKVVESVKQMDDGTRPNEFEIQLAIKLDSEIGAAIVKASSEAQMQVTMKWTVKETPRQP
ncbi:CU044_2847 family protein [Microcoleus sp. FACHB-672]|uniref:CU044_2847 family protein n=1 Tax=Microcoleus sp. FACHB-672 TaxID=2692825 RepID=UPI001A7E4389|nr:CU044_2847 family protein [Microcoleus sp. FACHB-672]